MSRSGTPRVAVLGAGPIGLEAALYARQLGLSVTVYEQGRPGEYWHRWGHVRLFSQFGGNSTPLGRAAIRKEHPKHQLPATTDLITGADHLAAYLEPLCLTELLAESVRADTRVVAVGRGSPVKGGDGPFRLLLREKGKPERVEEADVVLDCTGTYGRHRWVGDGGIPAPGEIAAEPHVAYGLEDVLGARKSHYAGKSMLVIGSGYSAATTVCQLSELAQSHPETWIIWLARGARSQPLPRIANDPFRERDRLAAKANSLATRGDGNVEFHPAAYIGAIECTNNGQNFTVRAICGGKPFAWEVDRVIANVGYRADTGIYPELRMPEPNLLVLGAKGVSLGEPFLLRTGFDQVREAFSRITGNARLDLYKAA
jgi:thioredoxin reductase